MESQPGWQLSVKLVAAVVAALLLIVCRLVRGCRSRPTLLPPALIPQPNRERFSSASATSVSASACRRKPASTACSADARNAAT